MLGCRGVRRSKEDEVGLSCQGQRESKSYLNLHLNLTFI